MARFTYTIPRDTSCHRTPLASAQVHPAHAVTPSLFQSAKLPHQAHRHTHVAPHGPAPAGSKCRGGKQPTGPASPHTRQVELPTELGSSIRCRRPASAHHFLNLAQRTVVLNYRTSLLGFDLTTVPVRANVHVCHGLATAHTQLYVHPE